MITRTELEEQLFKLLWEYAISPTYLLEFNEIALDLMGRKPLPVPLQQVYPLLERYNHLLTLNEEEFHAVMRTYRSLIGTGGLYYLAKVIYEYLSRNDPMYLPDGWSGKFVHMANNISTIAWGYKYS